MAIFDQSDLVTRSVLLWGGERAPPWLENGLFWGLIPRITTKSRPVLESWDFKLSNEYNVIAVKHLLLWFLSLWKNGIFDLTEKIPSLHLLLRNRKQLIPNEKIFLWRSKRNFKHYDNDFKEIDILTFDQVSKEHSFTPRRNRNWRRSIWENVMKIF